MKKVILISSEEIKNLAHDMMIDFDKLRELEQMLKQERNNYKVRLRIQMKQEKKTIQQLIEEWEEVQQSIITREMKLKTKYKARAQKLSLQHQKALEKYHLYYFELIFTVLKQYLTEILQALDELKCQTNI